MGVGGSIESKLNFKSKCLFTLPAARTFYIHSQTLLWTPMLPWECMVGDIDLYSAILSFWATGKISKEDILSLSLRLFPESSSTSPFGILVLQPSTTFPSPWTLLSQASISSFMLLLQLKHLSSLQPPRKIGLLHSYLAHPSSPVLWSSL